MLIALTRNTWKEINTHNLKEPSIVDYKNHWDCDIKHKDKTPLEIINKAFKISRKTSRILKDFR